MVRTLLLLLAALPGLWLYLAVFGWIVSGDIAFADVSIKREEKPGRFWLCILLFALVCLAIFGVALAFYVGAF